MLLEFKRFLTSSSHWPSEREMLSRSGRTRLYEKQPAVQHEVRKIPAQYCKGIYLRVIDRFGTCGTMIKWNTVVLASREEEYNRPSMQLTASQRSSCVRRVAHVREHARCTDKVEQRSGRLDEPQGNHKPADIMGLKPILACKL